MPTILRGIDNFDTSDLGFHVIYTGSTTNPVVDLSDWKHIVVFNGDGVNPRNDGTNLYYAGGKWISAQVRGCGGTVYAGSSLFSGVMSATDAGITFSYRWGARLDKQTELMPQDNTNLIYLIIGISKR